MVYASAPTQNRKQTFPLRLRASQPVPELRLPRQPVRQSESSSALARFREAHAFWNRLGNQYPSLHPFARQALAVPPHFLVGAHARASLPELSVLLAMCESGREALKEAVPTLERCKSHEHSVSTFPRGEKGLMPLAMRGVRTTRDLGQQTEHLSTQEALLWLGSVIEHGFAGSVSRDAGVELQRNAAPQTMRFLTYNVLGLPWALGLGTGKSWRYARIGDEIARLSPDVVALQEMFCPKTAALIAHAGYPHQALSRSMHGALGLFGGSGLAIISKHPVEFIREHTFVAKSGVEKQARKGLLLARLRTPNGLLDVLTGHLASPPESINCLVASSETAARVRAKQILELAAFLRQRPDADQVPLLSLGDWNVCEESHQYHDLKDHLGLDLHRERCPYELIQDQGLGREDRDHIAGYTFDPDRNLMAEGKENEPMRFDYIFYNGNRNERLAVRSGFEFVSPSLQYSDHFAPLVTLYSSR